MRSLAFIFAGRHLASFLVIGAIGSAMYPETVGAVPVWGFSSNRAEISITGARVVPLFTASQDSAHLVQMIGNNLVDFGNVQNGGRPSTDPRQAASGPAMPPAENTFKSVGVNQGLARGDAMLQDFGVVDPRVAIGRNVAEVYLAAAGSGSGTGENEIDFRVVQTGAAAIRFTIFATPTLAVVSSAAGDTSSAGLSLALEVFDPTGANKALWLPCGSTAAAGQADQKNCDQAGNGLTKDAGFMGTVNVLLDPFSLNIDRTCMGAGCTKVYQPGHGPGALGAFLLTVDVGQGNNIFADLDMFERVLVSGVQQANPIELPVLLEIPEPGTLLLLALGLPGLWRANRTAGVKKSVPQLR